MEQKGHHADERVVRKNVAPPDQVHVGQSHQEKYRHAREVHSGGTFVSELRAFDDQKHRGTEQQRKQAPHLAFDQDKSGKPRSGVTEVMTAPRQWGKISRLWKRKAGDVCEQDPHDGEAADNVEFDDPFGQLGDQ